VQVTPNIQGRVWRSGKPQDDFRFADISDYLAEPVITTIFETNLSLQDARLNTIMKKLTG
jgi:hypothetical protein